MEAEKKIRTILSKYLYKDEISKIIQEFERQGIILESNYQKAGN